MKADAGIGERVLELLSGIDLERPVVDEERATERLKAYLEALGLRVPDIRWLPNLRALSGAARNTSRGRSHRTEFHRRQSQLLDAGWSEDDVWRFCGVMPRFPHPRFRGAWEVAELDDTVLTVGLGLGLSDQVSAVRCVTSSLHGRAVQLSAGADSSASTPPDALVPLAEAADAGVFAIALGRKGDLVATSRPRLRLDTERRLHSWDGLPAAEWANGGGVYFWRGVGMTESAGRNPDRVTPSRIAGWANAERRRVAIERIGLERFLTGLDARVVQQDDYGRLWRTERDIGGEPLVAVEVVNATVEPDGTYRRYFLRVPPEARTARWAVAWTFGLTWRAYAPVAES